MKIWVDADACPNVIKDILIKASQRTGITLTFIANQFIRTPATKHITCVVVTSGFDVADNEIVARVEEGDLVITSDIPLASEVIDKGGLALSPRGELFTTENIRSRLNIRDFMDTMRASGVQSGGPPALNLTDRQNFANHLDRLITKFI